MEILTRDEAREKILHDIPCTDYLEKARNGGYVCIYCGSGKGEHGTGAVKYYRDTNTCACFACADGSDKGRKFDVLDLMQHYEHCDYNTALKIGADKLGLTIGAGDRIDNGWKAHVAGRKYPTPTAAGSNSYDINNLILDPLKPRQNGVQGAESHASAQHGEMSTADATKSHSDAQQGTDSAESKKSTTAGTLADYTDYYMECMQRLDDPGAISYLQARGISQGTAESYHIGFDPAADPASAPGAQEGEYKPHPCPRVIIPVTKSHYIARSIDPNTPPRYRVLNPSTQRGAGNPGIFNGRAIYTDGVIFVVEGVFDALSIIECGGIAIATNSANNIKTLREALLKQKTAAVFVLCPDNDEDPKTREKVQKRFKDLADGLQALGIRHTIKNIAGAHKDANDALRADRQALEAAIKEAIKEAVVLPEIQQAADQGGNELPGLLTFTGAVNIFKTANYETIEFKSFPEFSKTAKIKLHDSIVLAADTGGGKSSLAINFMNDLSEKYPCIYFNLEMDAVDVLGRLVAIQSGMEIDRIQGYQKDPKTAEAVNTALQAITSRKPIQVIQDAYLLEELEDIIKKSIQGRKEPTIVFIDHSLLMDTGRNSAGRYDRFTQISEGLRKMALRNDIILFVLLQQSRAGKALEEERPKNSSLKESGSWENDSTQICFLWYDPAAKRKKLLITKNRHGEIGEFTLNYWKKTQTYTEAKDQKTAAGPAGSPTLKKTRREKQREKLVSAYEEAMINTNGRPTLRAIAEAADVTTATVKTWIKEYGGCIVDGVQQDPAGIDTEVEYTGFIKMTPADDAESPFSDSDETDPTPDGATANKRL